MDQCGGKDEYQLPEATDERGYKKCNWEQGGEEECGEMRSCWKEMEFWIDEAEAMDSRGSGSVSSAQGEALGMLSFEWRERQMSFQPGKKNMRPRKLPLTLVVLIIEIRKKKRTKDELPWSRQMM
jgi:hypothetical protein